MTVETLVQAGLALVGVVGGVVSARSARRTKRQERRDDFTAVTEQQHKVAEQQNKAIERLEKRVALREREADRLVQRITDQDEAISWLRGRLRDVVGFIRIRGDEPPAARAMSERAARILNGIEL